MVDPIVQALSPQWTQNQLYHFLQDLTDEELFRQPSPIAPSIGWHIWHIARNADMFQASFGDRLQVWERDNLVATYGLKPSKLGLLQMGVLQTPQDAILVPKTIGKDRLVTYVHTVFEAVDDVFSKLTVDDLYRPRESILKIDWSAAPMIEGKGSDVLTIEDIVFHATHSQRHLGMIEALVGVIFERKGTATI